MSTIFIIHGVGGSPKENWFPWLQSELEKRGHKVIVPQFPTPEGQTLENWLTKLKEYEADLTSETIVVGHSLGGSFILNVLERYPVKAAYLVACVFGVLGNAFDEGMKSFAQRNFDWQTIRANCPRFEIFHSNNDPYIPLAKAQELSLLLSTPITLIKGAGHFNAASGYTKFEALLKAMDLKK
ncbi:MAG: alpha/beta fold hydrolase [Candidatus Gracilibacteria bacterium]|jgi:hypothetical protein